MGVPYDSYVSSGGGKATTSVPASPTGNIVISANAGRLCSVLVTTAGTGAGNVLIYDNATTNIGTVIGLIPATVSVTGVPYVFNNPAANGIVLVQVANGPVLTVSWF